MASERVDKKNLKEFAEEIKVNANILKRNFAYTIDQTVNKGQVVLKCTIAGTTDKEALNLSSVSVGDILTDGTAEWQVISTTGYGSGSGGTSISEWATSTSYETGQIVIYGDSLYRCITDHTSNTFNGDIANWELMYSDIAEWRDSVYYTEGVTVIHDHKLYQCITAHTSTSIFDGAKWQIIGDYVAVPVKVGSVGCVSWQYTLMQNHLALDGSVVSNFQATYPELYDFFDTNNLITTVQADYDANHALCYYDSTNDAATMPDFLDKTVWGGITITEKKAGLPNITGGINAFGVASNSVNNYVTGAFNGSYDNYNLGVSASDSFRRLNNLTLDASRSSSIYSDSVNTVQPPAITLIPQIRYTQDYIEGAGGGTSIEDWETAHSYSVGDLVIEDDKIWQCNTAHTSTTFNTDINNWTLISGSGLVDWQANTEYKVDDIFVYGGQIYKALVGFTSGATFAEIGILEDYTLQTGDTPILWAEGTEINTNDIVEYNSNYYKAKVDFTCGEEFTKVAFEEYVPKPFTDQQIEDIIEAFNPAFDGALGFVVQDNAPAHNAVFRSNDLTDYFNSGQMSEAIADGSFRNIFPGDYIIKSVTVNGTTYNNVKWIVGDLDYHLHSGDTETTAHHVLLFPETVIGTAQMNTSDTTSGGYVGSRMWTTTIPLYVTGITNAFGSAHVLQHRELLTTSMDTNGRSSAYCTWAGAANNWAWKDVLVNIFNENMIYGGAQCSSSMYDTGDGNTQIAVMRHHKSYIHTRSNWYWLRSVSSSAGFVGCNSGGGYAGSSYASSSGGLRPYFLLY